MKLTISLVLLLSGAPALALQDSETKCGWVMGKWTCRTSAQSSNPLGGLNNPADIGSNVTDSYNRAVKQRQERERAQLEADRLRAETERLNAETEALRNYSDAPQKIVPQTSFVATVEQRQAIGQLLKNGDCKDAIELALDSGDIELATNVQKFCSGISVAN